MNENQWMSLLGLANRARKIISGEELSVKEIQKRKSKACFIICRCFCKYDKKNNDKCKSYEVPYKMVENRDTAWPCDW